MLNLCFGLLAGCAPSSQDLPAAQNGVIDLRRQSFNQAIALDGTWLFYWRQLFAQPDSHAKGVLVNFPYKWSDGEISGKRLPAFGYATYQLTMLLPRTSGPLRIALPDVYSAYQLYINGRLAIGNGVVTTSAEGFVPYWQHQWVDLPEHTDTLTLNLQIANYAQ
jgi:hypothetical protein